MAWASWGLARVPVASPAAADPSRGSAPAGRLPGAFPRGSRPPSQPLADAIIELWEELDAHVADRGLSSVADPVRTLYLVLAADGAMNNDGPQELIDKQQGEPAVAALRAIGAGAMAEILRGL